MTLPSRFRKDLLRAAKQDEDGRIAINDMQKVIANISMEHRITEQEMETIFEEMGESGKIAADRLIQLMKTDE
jgi:Ca2+-binding EF-hand superfamily protein